MKLKQFYQKVVEYGGDCDPRPHRRDRLFPDTAILHGDPDAEINKILVGIDIEAPELLLADRIRQTQGLDLVIAHHPEGRAYVLLHEVMRLQISILTKNGISQDVAKRLLDERMEEVSRRILPQNHTRPVDVARILDIPYMCVHTPADNHVYRFIEKLFGDTKPKTVQDIVDILSDVPEYRYATESSCGPRILAGNPKRLAGRILVEMTGGTEGPKEILDKLYKAGVRTLVSMHLSEEHFKKVKETNLNSVIAGHISSDTLGLNLLLDKIEKSAGQNFETICCSGFNRIRRPQ